MNKLLENPRLILVTRRYFYAKDRLTFIRLYYYIILSWTIFSIEILIFINYYYFFYKKDLFLFSQNLSWNVINNTKMKNE